MINLVREGDAVVKRCSLPWCTIQLPHWHSGEKGGDISTTPPQIKDDAYWIRYFAAAAMQGCFAQDNFSYPKATMIHHAQELLDEIKRVEAEEKK